MGYTHNQTVCALQAENRECLRHLEEQNEHLQKARSEAEGQGQRVEELKTLLENLKLENASLRDKMAAGEAELQELRALKDGEDGKRWEERVNKKPKENTVYFPLIRYSKIRIIHTQNKLQNQNYATVIRPE